MVLINISWVHETLFCTTSNFHGRQIFFARLRHILMIITRNKLPPHITIARCVTCKAIHRIFLFPCVLHLQAIFYACPHCFPSSNVASAHMATISTKADQAALCGYRTHCLASSNVVSAHMVTISPKADHAALHGDRNSLIAITLWGLQEISSQLVEKNEADCGKQSIAISFCKTKLIINCVPTSTKSAWWVNGVYPIQWAKHTPQLAEVKRTKPTLADVWDLSKSIVASQDWRSMLGGNEARGHWNYCSVLHPQHYFV